MYKDEAMEELESQFTQEELEEFNEWFMSQNRYNQNSYDYRRLAIIAYLAGVASLKAQNNN